MNEVIKTLNSTKLAEYLNSAIALTEAFEDEPEGYTLREEKASNGLVAMPKDTFLVNGNLPGKIEEDNMYSFIKPKYDIGEVTLKLYWKTLLTRIVIIKAGKDGFNYDFFYVTEIVDSSVTPLLK